MLCECVRACGVQNACIYTVDLLIDNRILNNKDNFVCGCMAAVAGTRLLVQQKPQTFGHNVQTYIFIWQSNVYITADCQ